ncbi:MAG: pilus assembly protein PilM [Blastopirellula sp.]|nr:MAG: pilus assembly protein PilM [Blastopirellula sp.]
MASSKSVWGIDIGHSAIKALRCKVHEDGFWLVADAFDYIEYPKLLTQAEANPEEMVRDALSEFLSRNDLTGDSVAISVPGQAGLSRFFKAPPVEAKRIPDIVRYEAKQQIPFPLEDVVWDFQQMPGAQDFEGIAMDAEVGIFAMKRDQVFRSLQPFNDAEIDIDFIQLTPVSLYNYVTHDLLPTNPSKGEYDPDNQPDSYAVISMGTETTDLVITNGFRVWQRSLPIGGNHFTKKLTAELKLTFAKAEHLKKNAREAEDPKLIFQAMRPVFNDFVTELQRSIGFFQTLDRKAKITKIVPVGNAMKMPGLISYLGKNLGYDVVEVEGFQKMTGTDVTSAPAFHDHILSFPTCYGLCLQGLQKSTLQTNLLPQEIVVERLIRGKKPWAIGAVAALFLACVINYSFHAVARNAAFIPAFDDSIGKVDSIVSTSARHKSTDSTQLADALKLKEIGAYVVGNAENRRLWPELMRAISVALPVDPTVPAGQVSEKPINERPNLYIDSIENEYFPDLTKWYTEGVKGKFEETIELRLDLQKKTEKAALEAAAAEAGAEAEEGVDPADLEIVEGDAGEDFAGDEGAEPTAEEAADERAGPTESGWVIQLSGYHYHNSVKGKKILSDSDAQYVRDTLLNQLDSGSLMLPDKSGQMVSVSMRELGISHALIIADKTPYDFKVDNPDYLPPAIPDPTDPMAIPGGAGAGPGNLSVVEDPDNPRSLTVRKYEFVIQFCWRETPLSVRLENQRHAAAVAAGEITDEPEADEVLETEEEIGGDE